MSEFGTHDPEGKFDNQKPVSRTPNQTPGGDPTGDRRFFLGVTAATFGLALGAILGIKGCEETPKRSGGGKGTRSRFFAFLCGK